MPEPFLPRFAPQPFGGNTPPSSNAVEVDDPDDEVFYEDVPTTGMNSAYSRAVEQIVRFNRGSYSSLRGEPEPYEYRGTIGQDTPPETIEVFPQPLAQPFVFDQTAECVICHTSNNPTCTIQYQGNGRTIDHMLAFCEDHMRSYTKKCHYCNGIFGAANVESVRLNNRTNVDACMSCRTSQTNSCRRCGNRHDRSATMLFETGARNCIECTSSLIRNGELEYRDTEIRSELIHGSAIGTTLKSLRPFGVELEVIRPKDAAAIKAVDEIPQYVGVGSDSSISGGKGLELRFPPASGKIGEDMINQACSVLNKYKFKVNSSCGYHVHVDVSDIDRGSSDEQLNIMKSIWATYLAFEDVIQSFLSFSRRDNEYCQSLRSAYHLDEVFGARNVGQLEKLWYRLNSESEVSRAKAQHRHMTRRRGINLHMMFAERHLEIRYHTGTINALKVNEWANLHCLIVDMAIRNAGEYSNQQNLQRVCNSIDINWKTNELFKRLKLSQESIGYFSARQLHFVRPIEAQNSASFKAASALLNEDKEQ